MKKQEPKDKKKKIVYKALNYDDIPIYQTWVPSWKQSQNSFSFSDERKLTEKNALKIISDTFGLDAKKVEAKFKESIGGSGNELKRISVLHSSSLCAFLHFHNVSIGNPIKIDDIVYDQVFFEVQNKVIDNRNPSNIDIVLISKDEDENEKTKNKKTILFLESKFSEYLYQVKTKNVSFEYKEKYDKIHGLEELYKCDDSKNPEEITLSCRDRKLHYIEGIKQLLSHYIGVCDFIEKNYKSFDNKIEMENPDNDLKVLIAEIVFDGWEDNEECKAALEDYKEQFGAIADILNKNNSKIKVRKEILTYKELFNEEFNKNLINDKIRKFYRYDEK